MKLNDMLTKLTDGEVKAITMNEGKDYLFAKNHTLWYHNCEGGEGELSCTLDDLIVLANADWEAYEPKPKAILDNAEKKYLGTVIKLFRKRVKYISKRPASKDKYWIRIGLKDGDIAVLPLFRHMYEGMEADRMYTLEELGL